MSNTDKYFGGGKFLEPRIEQNEQDITELDAQQAVNTQAIINNAIEIALKSVGYARMNTEYSTEGTVVPHGHIEITENITCNGSRWTAQVAGWYDVSWEGLTASTIPTRLALAKNRTTVPSDVTMHFGMGYTPTGTDNNRPVDVTGMVYLDVGDWVELWLIQGGLYSAPNDVFGNFKIHKV